MGGLGYPAQGASPQDDFLAGLGDAGSQGVLGGPGTLGPLGPPVIAGWPRKKSWSARSWGKVLGIGVAIGLGVLLLVWVVGLLVKAGSGGPAAFNPASVALPSFPERPALQPLPGGASFTSAELPVPPGKPGSAGKLFVYLPAGNHQPESLPCVFCAPEGGTLLSGVSLTERDRGEHLAWVEAGFAVVAYEQDGPLSSQGRLIVREELCAAYPKFAAAQAGLVNARNAIEYTLSRVFEVDRKRLYAAGFGSAGTMALLLAAHEPRLRGCAAINPMPDPAEDATACSMVRDWLDKSAMEFLRRSSPATHARRVQCPVYIFHDANDMWHDIERSKVLAAKLQGLGKNVTLDIGGGAMPFGRGMAGGMATVIRWMKNTDKPGSGDVAQPAPPPTEPADPRSTGSGGANDGPSSGIQGGASGFRGPFGPRGPRGMPGGPGGPGR